jgi:hypothetical protein
LGDLRLDIDTAINASNPKRGELRVLAEIHKKSDPPILGQGQNEGTNGMAGRRRAGTCERQKSLQNRQRESSGLAGSGLRSRHHVAARHHQGIQAAWTGVGV